MDRSRAQFAYRLGFVLLCFLPTVCTAGWIVARSLPGFALAQRDEWERELTRRLGLRVTCQAVDYSRPDAAVVTGIMLRDLETDVPIATVAALEFARGDHGWQVTGRQAVVDAAQFPALQERLEQNLLRLPASEIASCQVSFRELTLQQGERGLTLVDVTGQVQPCLEGLTATLQFRLPEADRVAPPASIVITRNRATMPPSTRWQFNSGSLPLPCALVAGVVPLVGSWGGRATFVGDVDLVQSAGELSGTVRGVVQDLDLDALVSEQFPHQLSGLATCKIEEAAIHRGRLQALRGTMQARDGLISTSLLVSAAEHLQLTPLAVQLPAGNATVSYRHLACGFDLRDTGLQLSGGADPTRPTSGVLMVSSAAGALLEAPPQHRVHPLALVRALSPESESQVPAARPAQDLARWMPAAAQSGGATARRPDRHTPTRLLPSRDSQTPPLMQPR